MDRLFYYQVEPNPPTTLMDQLYQTGKILTFDSESESEEPVHVGHYTVPVEVAGAFLEFMDQLESELPIAIHFGTEKACKALGAQSLLISEQQMLAPLDDLEDEEYAFEQYEVSKRRQSEEDEES